MDASEMKQYICKAFDGVKAVDSSGDTFFMYDPDGDLPAERQFPFVTIVTGDHYDSVSKLNRPGAYRLNIGPTKATYAAWFGAAPTRRDATGTVCWKRDSTMPRWTRSCRIRSTPPSTGCAW
jgi:hypothetical protein